MKVVDGQGVKLYKICEGVPFGPSPFAFHCLLFYCFAVLLCVVCCLLFALCFLLLASVDTVKQTHTHLFRGIITCQSRRRCVWHHPLCWLCLLWQCLCGRGLPQPTCHHAMMPPVDSESELRAKSCSATSPLLGCPLTTKRCLVGPRSTFQMGP